jgi:hypothetical protein
MHAQAPVAATIRNWGISLRDKVTGRLEMRFASSQATPAPGPASLAPTLWDVEDLRLETFDATESPNLAISSPRCRVDLATRDVSSPGSLRVVSPSDSLALDGTGFVFQNATRTLTLTNSVRIQIRAALFRFPSE